MSARVNQLLDKAKRAVAAGESHLRKAAELIAQAQDTGATQQQIAKGVGRSQPWVAQLLQWRKSGFKGGAFERSHKARISRANKPKVPPRQLMTPELANAMRARAEAVVRLFPPLVKTIPESTRAQLIKALTRIDDPLVETIRKRLNLTWDDLIVPGAVENDVSAAA